MADIPTGKLARASLVGKAALKVGVHSLKKKTLKKKTLSNKTSSNESESEVFDQDMGRMIFSVLAKLRGAGLKVAQMISAEHTYLPESFRNELSKACYQAPPINRALIRKVVQTQLGQAPEFVFQKFENKPFAAASLGQVHLAQDHHGNKLAVKVQYPGIADSIRSDLALLKPMLKSLPKHYQLQHLLPEIEQRLLEEVDYLHEMEVSQQFSKLVDSHPKLSNVQIQQVLPELTTKTLLVSEFIEGQHLDQWVAENPDKKLKQNVAQSLLDFFFIGLKHSSRLHSDPNLGNFLVTTNGQLAVIDFGASYPISAEVSANYLALLKAFRDQNLNDIQTAIERCYLGGKKQKWSENVTQSLKVYADWKSQFFREGGFDFSQHPDYLQEGMKAGYQAFQSEKWVFEPDPDVMFIERVLFGYLQMCQNLGAHVHLCLDELSLDKEEP